MNEQPKNSLMLRLRPLVFLLPAVITGLVILGTLPTTQPILSAIPERLERISAEVTEAVVSPLFEEAEPEDVEPEELPQGPYTDGVYTGSSQGYGGLVTVQVTVENGRIADIEILSAPGETEPYITLAQTIIGVVIDQQTWETDAVSGATYSSRGILGAVQNALTGETVENEAPAQTAPAGTTVQDSFTEPSSYKDGTYDGSAEGFGGSIRVEVVISGSVITSIRIVSAPYETAEYLNRAKSVITSILSTGSPNVDAVSGATYSSTGIINAVKRALMQATADSAGIILEDDPDAEDPNQETPGPEKADQPLYRDGSYTVSGWCEDEDGTFRYEITVTIVIKDGRIASVEAVKGTDDSEEPELNETYMGYAVNGRTRKDVDYAGVPQQIVDKQGADAIDAVSGATYSSRAIIEAAQQAFDTSGSGSPAADIDTSEQTKENDNAADDREDAAEIETDEQQDIIPMVAEASGEPDIASEAETESALHADRSDEITEIIDNTEALVDDHTPPEEEVGDHKEYGETEASDHEAE